MGGGTCENFLIVQSHCDKGKIFQEINFKLHKHTFGVWGQRSIDLTLLSYSYQYHMIHKKLTPWGGGTYAIFLINRSHCDRGKVFRAINFKLHIHTFGVWGQCSIDFQTDPLKNDPVGGHL